MRTHLKQDGGGPHIVVGDGSLTLNGPGALWINGNATLPVVANRKVSQVTNTITLHPLHSDTPLRATAVLGNRSERRPDAFPIQRLTMNAVPSGSARAASGPRG